jgi:hypothetical protein
MGDVINMQDRRRQPEAANAAQTKADRAAHAARIRERLKTSWQLELTPREEVAKAIHRLLERATKAGVTKDAILRAAGLKSASGPTKHLSQYALQDDLPEETRQRRLDKLRKKAPPYARIAEAAARLAGLDIDDTLSEVFQAVPLDVAADPAMDAELAPYEDLAAILRRGMTAIARRFDLARYFQQVRSGGLAARVVRHEEAEEKHPNSLRADDLEIVFDQHGRYDWDIRFGLPTHQAGHEGEDSIVCYPGVSLGEWQVERFDGVRLLTVEGDYPVVSGMVGGAYVAELRLCIAPIEPDSRPEPALRIALRAKPDPIALPAAVHPEEGSATQVTFGNYWNLSLQKGAEVLGSFGPGEGMLTFRVDSAGAQLPKWVREYFGDVSASKRPAYHGVRFFPLTGRVLRDWLRFDVPGDADEFWDDREDAHVFYGHSTGVGSIDNAYGGYSPLPGFTLAAAVDRALWAYRDGLLDELADRAERLTAAFAEAVSEQQATRERNLRALEERWTGDDPA